jgi:hypothetical protein
MMLQVTLPAIEAPTGLTDASGNAVTEAAAYWVNCIGFAMLQEVELEIGGQHIDTLYSEWIFAWYALTQRPGAQIREQIGQFDFHADVELDMIEFAKTKRDVFIPLPFWFNKYFLEKGLCLPMIALTYHEIKLKITFRPLSECVVTVYKHTDATWGEVWLKHTSLPKNIATGSTLSSGDITAALLVTYIYLDTDEREAFVEVEHEYLITTLQRQTASITSANAVSDQIKLYFNHPCNVLYWLVRPNNWADNRRRFSVGHMDRFDYTLAVADPTVSYWGDAIDAVKNTQLTLNGHDRFPNNLPSVFFRAVQPGLLWENVPTSLFSYMFTFAAQGGVWNPTSTLLYSVCGPKRSASSIISWFCNNLLK